MLLSGGFSDSGVVEGVVLAEAWLGRSFVARSERHACDKMINSLASQFIFNEVGGTRNLCYIFGT